MDGDPAHIQRYLDVIYQREEKLQAFIDQNKDNPGWEKDKEIILPRLRSQMLMNSKLAKLREDIRVYSDENKSQEVLSIQARQIIDFSAAYDVVDTAMNQKIGTLRRKGWSSILRDEWQVLDANENQIGVLFEDSMGLALLRRFHEARVAGAPEVVVWGSGTPRREFLHADDLAAAVVHLMNGYSDEAPVNVGCGEDLSIRELAEMIAEVVGYTGRISWDRSKPDGTPRKLLDVSRITALGWTPRIPLREGIAATYAEAFGAG